MGSDFYLAYLKPYAGIIIKICRAYTNTQHDFEDYYQEVCLQIWRSRERFQGKSEWSTWVYRISLNVCMTYLKQEQKGKSTNNDNAELNQLTAEDTSQAQSDIDLLYNLIRQLSDIDRAIILLYLEQQSYQQIAEITGTNSNHVGVKITRIKQRLTEQVKIQQGAA